MSLRLSVTHWHQPSPSVQCEAASPAHACEGGITPPLAECHSHLRMGCGACPVDDPLGDTEPGAHGRMAAWCPMATHSVLSGPQYHTKVASEAGICLPVDGMASPEAPGPAVPPPRCLVQLHTTSFPPLTPGAAGTAGWRLPHHDEIRCRVLPGPSPTQSWQPSVSPRVWAKQFTQVCVLLLDSKRQTRQYPSFSAGRDAKCSVCLSRWRGHPCSALTLTSSAERGGHCPGLREGDLAPSAVHMVREGLHRTVSSSSPTPIYVPW